MKSPHNDKMNAVVRLLLQLPILAVGAALVVGCASTGSMTGSMSGIRPTGLMAEGARTTPPAGFIDLCVRQPSECALKVHARAGMDPAVAAAEAQKAMYRKYYWEIAFQQAQPAALRAESAFDHAVDANARVSVLAHTSADPMMAAAADEAPSATDSDGIEELRSAPVRVALDNELAGRLNMVNRLINASIRQVSDAVTHGTADYWALPLSNEGVRVGDCEDYVLEKRRALMAGGVPAAALSIAIVRTRRGEDHAVLLVSTDQGELVMDSLSPYVLGWRDAPYQWVERQMPGDQMVWVRAGAPMRQGGVRQVAALR